MSPAQRAYTLQQIDAALAVIKSSAPITQKELTSHRSLCAAEDARAEARRAASPQLPLGKVA